MDAKEIRIGNYLNVFYKGEFKEIHTVEIATFSMFLEGFDLQGIYFEPIPLTEEWLLRFGFEKIIDNEFTLRYELKKDQRFDYFLPKHNLKTFGLRFQGSTFFDVVKYLHQLQNLYFALCGKELQLQ